MQHYHNTTALTGEELHHSRTQAQAQEARVLQFFMDNPGREFTPAEVFNAGVCGSAPITSVRRAITNLTNEMLLVRCNDQRQGMYGKPNWCWRLAEKRQYQQGRLL